MGTGGGRIDSYYARGMLEIRSSLHLAFRLTIRANQALDPTGAATAGAGLWRFALPAFALLDICVWWFYLRRNDRFGLSWRLPMDAFDAAYWTMSPLPNSGHADLALLIVVPLAVEAGVRMGWRSLVVPGAVLITTTAAGVATGTPVQVVGLMWIALAAAVGRAMYRYCTHLAEQAELERGRRLAAARWRAYLAGQNHVAMGASSAVDVIEGLVPVLGRPPAGSALWRLADGWKSQLRASTAQEAKYLQVAVLEWERVHNAHPDLSGLVDVQVAEGHGTTLLTAAQVQDLHRALEDRALHGLVHVARTDAATAHLPGQALRLDVDGETIVIPADRRALPPTFDPAPIAYLYIGALVLAWLTPAGGTLPAPAVVAGLALCAAASLVSYRRTVGRGGRARLGVFAIAVAVGTALTALTYSAQTPVNEDGVAVMGFGVGVVLVSFVGGFYWNSLGPWRWAVPVAVAANVTVGLLVHPEPSAIDLRVVVASVLYNVFPFFPLRHLAQALGRAARQHAVWVTTVDEEAEQAAFLEGRESVVGLVRQARQDALDQLTVLGRRLDNRLALLATDRLEEVERRLQTIDR